MLNETEIKGFIAALGIGLLIGIVRERMSEEDHSTAGIRTHALIAILGSSTWFLGIYVFLSTLFILGLLTVFAYRATSSKDPGLTGEVSSLLTFILSALSMEKIGLATSLGVFCSILIQAKSSIHKLTKEILTEGEVNDGLLLLASVLIILPILPDQAIDPWKVIIPGKIWTIVLIIMISGMMGHILKRILGEKLGFPLAGFFSGFISSTATIAQFGAKAKENTGTVYQYSGPALLANLSSLLLLASILGTTSPFFLKSVAPGLGTGIVFFLIIIFITLRKTFLFSSFSGPHESRAFKLSHALSVALAITFVSSLSGLTHYYFGEMGVIVSTSIVAVVELHSAAIGLAQLSLTQIESNSFAKISLFFILLTSSFGKIGLAYVSGGRKYAAQIALGLGSLLFGTMIGLILF
jgi:uncharacterized membrane protein (DUF4010 family)